MLPGLLILIVILAAGCSGERSFEPDEFVNEANREGAGLVLGEPLTTIEEGVDVFAVSFKEEDGEHASRPEPEAGHTHSGGSLVVTDDVDSAVEEFDRCETAVTLTCYRAANIVLYFDGEPTDEHIAEVDAAVRALGSE